MIKGNIFLNLFSLDYTFFEHFLKVYDQEISSYKTDFETLSLFISFKCFGKNDNVI